MIALIDEVPGMKWYEMYDLSYTRVRVWNDYMITMEEEYVFMNIFGIIW